MSHLKLASASLALVITASSAIASAQTGPAAATGSPFPQEQPPAAQQPAYPQQSTYAQPQYAPYAYPSPYYPPATRGRRVPRPIVGYRSVTRPDPRLWGAGLAMFLAGWVVDFAVLTPIANAISTDRDGASEQDSWAWSLVPIVGPFVQLGIQAPHPAIPITMELLQLGGAALIIAGLVSNQTIRVPILQGDPEDPNVPRLDVAAQPMLGGGTIGLVYTHL